VQLDTIRVVNGRARLTSPSEIHGQAFGPNVVAGAPAYMAPEVWDGDAKKGSDQYALACTYAELRTGRLPFRGPDVSTVKRSPIQAGPDLSGCNDG
jgi:serine/threonine protein kinase